MPKLSRTIRDEFAVRVSEINSTRINFENAFNSGIISDVDIVQGYAGLYLDLFTEFENLIEQLFFGIISGSISHSNNSVIRKIRIKPVSKVEEVIKGEKRAYVDWLPYKENTIKRAQIYLDQGKPFTNLTSQQKGKLTTFHKIRNAIAHKSKKVNTQFQMIIVGLTLLPVEKSPSGFLRNIPNASSGATQLEIIADELLSISNTLCT